MFITSQQLTTEELEKKELEFQEVFYANDNELVYKELKQFFDSGNSPEKFEFSYWRWYVLLTWDRLNSLGQDDLIKVFAIQVRHALKFGIDVWSKLMWYFVTNNFFDEDLELLYIKIKKSFLDSEAALVKEYTILQSRKSDSIEFAEFKSRLERLFFPNVGTFNQYFTSNKDIAMETYIGLIEFFQDVDEKKIWGVVNDFLNQKKAVAPVESRVLENDEEIEELPDPSKLKSQIESEFKRNSQGEFENVEGVLNKLNELSEKYKDPKIAEMYYFDEKDGNFKWSI